MATLTVNAAAVALYDHDAAGESDSDFWTNGDVQRDGDGNRAAQLSVAEEQREHYRRNIAELHHSCNSCGRQTEPSRRDRQQRWGSQTSTMATLTVNSVTASTIDVVTHHYDNLRTWAELERDNSHAGQRELDGIRQARRVYCGSTSGRAAVVPLGRGHPQRGNEKRFVCGHGARQRVCV